MKEIYQDGTYEEKNPTWHEEDAPWKAGHISRMLKRHNVPVQSVAEVGCGSGEILLSLEKDFPATRFAGYEISPQAFSRTASKGTDRTHFFLSDLLEDKTAPTYDVILAIDVFEHVEDYMSFLKKLRPLAPFKVFHVPLDLSAQSVFRGAPIMRMREDVGHLHYFSKDTALATLADCGYEIVDYAYTASRLELPNQAFSSRVMKVPRRMMFALNPDMTVRVLGGYSLLVLAK